MKVNEHLTKNQISAYFAGAFGENDSREVGKHLLSCAACRSLLPMPSVEKLWSAVLTERETEENPTAEKSDYSLISVFSSVPAFFAQSGNFALSGAALLIVLLSFSALLWFGAGNSENEISQSFVIDNPEIVINRDAPFAAPNSESDNRFSTPDVNPNVAVSTPKSVKAISPKQNSVSAAQKNSNELSERKPPTTKNISATRGVTPKCEDGQAVQSSAVASGEKIVLNWEKVPNAAKYHLYISDEDEILVGEFETTEATSYVLEKPLDAGKIYKWKIIATLEGGKTIIGDSQKFTVKDLQTKQKKPGSRRNSAIRCSVNSSVKN